MASLDMVRETLEHKNRPTYVFFRDDDAGWANDRLLELAELFADRSIPLDMAVIPADLDDECINQIADLLHGSPHLFHIHQHGYSHENHETTGRKSEFGNCRAAQDQFVDIEKGYARLLDIFGDRVEPIFTPPWNRCTQDTVDALNEAGLSILSRDIGAESLALTDLVEIPVAVDWVKLRNADKSGNNESTNHLSKHLAGADVVGIMLHHEHMDGAELDYLDNVLNVLQASRHVSFASIIELATRNHAQRIVHRGYG